MKVKAGGWGWRRDTVTEKGDSKVGERGDDVLGGGMGE